MLASVFPSPYVDILKQFSKDWTKAELAGDVQEVIDKAIGKKVFAIRGTTAASNYLALPKSGGVGLGLNGKYLYLQLRLIPGQPFTIHIDLATDAKFVVRVSLSNRYSAVKRVGTVVQLPCPVPLARTAGQWTMLALDLPRLTASVVEPATGLFGTLKSVIACCSVSLRAAFTSDIAYTPQTLPRPFTLPIPADSSYEQMYGWHSIPPSPPSPAALLSTQSVSPEPHTKTSPPSQPASSGPRTAPSQDVLRRRQRSGAAPRALFPPAPQKSEPAEEALLKLNRVVGFSGERPGLLVWLSDGRHVLYATSSVLVLQDVDTASQRFLMGHTADICAISAAESTSLIASAQEGAMPIIRLWDRDACVPLAILRQHESNMHAISLSPDGSLLAGVGKDSRGRQMLAVWDVTQANAPVPSCPVIDAKVSQTHIKTLAWVPPDPIDTVAKANEGKPPAERMQLVSCGYENVRFWRLRRGKLHVCGMELQHEEGSLFLSIAVDQPQHGGGGAERKGQRRMLVGSSTGRLFVIDPTTRTLEFVHALHEDAIHAVHLSAGFAVTGGADRKLRVWPLDFSAHFLEAEHEGSVTAIHASPDGLKLIIGTASGTIGMLDVPTLKHATIVRSHMDIIYGLAIDPHNREFVTASCDGSIRVWELDGNQAQLVEFELPSGCSRSVAYHPTEYAIACGFDDGSMRVFDIASTSLLEEYTQHRGKVVDLLFTHAADKLFSAGTDCAIYTYDVLHSYQPSRSYSTAPFEGASPCLAIAQDDTVLVAGCLQKHAVLLFDLATLTVLATVPTSSNATAVVFGPARTLFMSTAEGELISLPLSASAAADADASAEAALVPNAHKAAIDAITVSRNGAHVVSGGEDNMLKVWPIGALRKGGVQPTGSGPGTCQRYVGHSDHITKIAFSADGQTLITVGGGDAIFMWEYVGPAGVDPAEVVEESVRQAEVDRNERLSGVDTLRERVVDSLPTPANVFARSPGGTAAPAPAANPKPVMSGPEELVADAKFEELRARLQQIDTAEAGYIMAGVEAARTHLAEELAGIRGDRVQQDEEDPIDDEPEENEEPEPEEDDDETEMLIPGPRKRFTARVAYGDEEKYEFEKHAVSHEGAAAAEVGNLAPAVASMLKLNRLIGFSAHAHDHVIWHAASGKLLYATGDTLVIDGILPGTPPAYLTGGSGEISTLALSPDGRFAAVGSGGDSPTCVYDLSANGQDGTAAALRMRLPGHEGGVQSLAFLGNAALASLGVEDGTLAVHSIVSGAQLLSTPTEPYMHTLAVSADAMEMTVAGMGGLHTWRVSTQPTGEGTSRPALVPLETRTYPTAETTEELDEDIEITSLTHISPSLSVAGDSCGTLTLWASPSIATTPIATFDLSDHFDEIDLIHAIPISQPSANTHASWHIIVGGAGPEHSLRRYRLTLPHSAVSSQSELVLSPMGELELDGDAIAFSWDAKAEQGVVGTNTGSVWHVEWQSLSKTLLVGAVPPPLSAFAVGPSTAQRVVASLSSGEVQGERCGVLLWDLAPPKVAASDPNCAAPLARIYQPNEEATCVALSPPTAEHEKYSDPDGADGLCAVGYGSGRLQIVSVSGLKLLKERRVHMAPVRCVRFGPSRTIITAASNGEVRLHSAAMGELLAPLATLRAPTNMPVCTIDVLVGSFGATDSSQPPRWLVASEHQEIEVWPLLARTDSNVHPIAAFSLETGPLLKTPYKLKALGWKCLAVFCPHRPNVIAAAGVTRDRRITLYDYMQHVPLAHYPLDEWPTCLAVSSTAPLLAVGGASGSAKLLEYQPTPQTPAEMEEEEEVMMAAVLAMQAGGNTGVVGGLIRSTATLELHCHNVRSLEFTPSCLYTAADDEVSQWELPF